MKNIDCLTACLPDGAFIVQNPQNLRYLTGSDIDMGVLILCKNATWFITDFRYIEKAEIDLEDTGINVVLQKKLSEDIGNILRQNDIHQIYVENDYQTISALAFFEKICMVRPENLLSETLSALRMIKQPEELELIRQAQKITDDAFTHILDYIKPGKTEKQIALEIEMYMRSHGAQDVSFDLIAVSGKNSALPHGVPTDKPVQPGEFLTLDIGCKYNGYCSDMTRTVAIGFADEAMRRVYETVLQAQHKALDVIHAGVCCSRVDAAAREVIDAAGYQGCFGHATGHGVGLYIHEEPRLAAGCETILQPGMVVTVEPGIYLKGQFGVRIEDFVAVTADGCENLTHSPKELLILK